MGTYPTGWMEIGGGVSVVDEGDGLLCIEPDMDDWITLDTAGRLALRDFLAPGYADLLAALEACLADAYEHSLSHEEPVARLESIKVRGVAALAKARAGGA